MKNYQKWNNRSVSPVTHSYAYRQIFVDFVSGKNFRNILEIGPGDLIEYKQIKRITPDIKYTIVDVSDTVLNRVIRKHPNIVRIASPVEDIGSKVKYQEFDCVYVSSVFEHTNDVRTAIRNVISSAKYFQFVFF